MVASKLETSYAVATDMQSVLVVFPLESFSLAFRSNRANSELSFLALLPFVEGFDTAFDDGSEDFVWLLPSSSIQEGIAMVDSGTMLYVTFCSI